MGFWEPVKNQILPVVAAEGINGVKEIGKRFIGNYNKRRNVGFEVIPSISGSFQETKNYYGAILSGKNPVETKQAVYFN